MKTRYEDYSGEWQRTVKVPQAWLAKAVEAIRTLEPSYGKRSRFLHIGGAVAVAFRRGAELVIPCPHGASEAYRTALERALKA